MIGFSSKGRGGSRRRNPLDESLILSLHSEGKNPSQIASMIHVGARRVRDVLVREGKLTVREQVCEACGVGLSGHGAIRFCDDCVPDSRFNNLYHKYGITKRDYDRMLIEQGGKCALCDRPPTHVDHCHSTGVVRGLLCTWCNSSLGRIDDDPNWADRALEYRMRGHS